MESLISAVIPSRNDPYLQKTIDSLKENATGNIEVVAVIDGEGDTPNADVVVRNDTPKGMRYCINAGVEASHGKYILKSDSHCKFAKGWDEALLSDIDDDWVVTPMRYRLDVDTWDISKDEPDPIIYERLVIDRPDKIGGVRWHRKGREGYQVDENMVFQGSCWLMSRKHWEWLGGLSEEGYGTFTQEPVEIALKTWLGGGKVVVNKKTWYAHKHRKYKRTYASRQLSEENEKGNKFSQDYWLNNRWEARVHDLSWLMERFGL